MTLKAAPHPHHDLIMEAISQFKPVNDACVEAFKVDYNYYSVDPEKEFDPMEKFSGIQTIIEVVVKWSGGAVNKLWVMSPEHHDNGCELEAAMIYVGTWMSWVVQPLHGFEDGIVVVAGWVDGEYNAVEAFENESEAVQFVQQYTV